MFGVKYLAVAALLIVRVGLDDVDKAAAADAERPRRAVHA